MTAAAPAAAVGRVARLLSYLEEDVALRFGGPSAPVDDPGIEDRVWLVFPTPDDLAAARVEAAFAGHPMARYLEAAYAARMRTRPASPFGRRGFTVEVLDHEDRGGVEFFEAKADTLEQVREHFTLERCGHSFDCCGCAYTVAIRAWPAGPGRWYVRHRWGANL